MDKKLLNELFSIGSFAGGDKSMNKYIYNYLKKGRYKVKKDVYGNIYAEKGSDAIKPCFVCHTDTVHTHKKAKVYIDKNVLFTLDSAHKQVGCGGDDKCGIYACFKLLEKLDNVKVVFFRNEEIGCAGSYVADMKFFKNAGFVAGLDRKGKSDLVSNIYEDIATEDFLETISTEMATFKRVEKAGALTDVLALADNDIKCSCINLSVGYYRPHTDKEIVKLDELQETIDFCIAIAEYGCIKHKAPKKDKVIPSYFYGEYVTDYVEDFHFCPMCNSFFDEDYCPYCKEHFIDIESYNFPGELAKR